MPTALELLQENQAGNPLGSVRAGNRTFRPTQFSGGGSEFDAVNDRRFGTGATAPSAIASVVPRRRNNEVQDGDPDATPADEPGGFTGNVSPEALSLGLTALGLAVPAFAPLSVPISIANAITSLTGGEDAGPDVGNTSTAEDVGADEQSGPPSGPAGGVGSEGPGGDDVDGPDAGAGTPGEEDTGGEDVGGSPSGGGGPAGGVGSEGDSGDGDGKIICNELYRQGLMSEKIWRADERFGEMVRRDHPEILEGYQVWAKYVVAGMQRSPMFTRFMRRLVRPWSIEMAYQQGVLRNGNFIGRLMMMAGRPICYAIGTVKYNMENGNAPWSRIS